MNSAYKGCYERKVKKKSKILQYFRNFFQCGLNTLIDPKQPFYNNF